MNKQIRQNLVTYLKQGFRLDGRKPTELRPFTVETGISRSAEGSARVRIGKTEVLAGVKMAAQKPYPDRPNEGTLMVNAELRPLASPQFESGPPGDWATEMARVVDRGIRESHVIDTAKLCVTPGELVWAAMIDVIAVNDDGNLLDAAGLAALAALKDARMPGLKNNLVDYEHRTDEKLPLAENEPLPVTVYSVDGHLFVDPTSEEEEAYDARLTIATTKDGELCALQKGGEGPLSVDEIDKMVRLAVEKSQELRKALR